MWVDRTGRQLGQATPPGLYRALDLSRDDKRVVLERDDPQTQGDIWVLDLARSSSTRLTFEPTWEWAPVWSPDGSRVAFGWSPSGPSPVGDIHQKASSGTGAEDILLKGSDMKSYGSRTPAIAPTDWSNDGLFLIFSAQVGSRGDLWALPLFGSREPMLLVEDRGEVSQSQGRLSPDGRWLAYTSNETGVFELYVQAFPTPGDRWTVSTSGGTFPAWRHDGKELFYVSRARQLMSVTVRGDRTFEPGIPTPLFQIEATSPYSFLGGMDARRLYRISADGQRFLVLTSASDPSSSSVTVVLNWPAALKK